MTPSFSDAGAGRNTIYCTSETQANLQYFLLWAIKLCGMWFIFFLSFISLTLQIAQLEALCYFLKLKPLNTRLDLYKTTVTSALLRFNRPNCTHIHLASISHESH